MSDPLIVQKYGGSSLDSPARIRSVAANIADCARRRHRMIVIVSAMGKTTDGLLSLAHDISPRPPRRELDMLLTVGERISMSLLSMALNDLGIPAISFTGSQSGIVTDTNHTGASIEEIRADRIIEALREGKVAIVAGFQGVSRSREITTLGRGGSDTTAVALAGSLKADRCEIYSDYPGLFTADPRYFPRAKRVPEIGHDEMLELASLGAKVLHYRAADLARKCGVTLMLLSSFTDSPGTVVRERTDMELPAIKSITSTLDAGALTASYTAPEGRADTLVRMLEEKGVKLVYFQRSSTGRHTTVHCVVEENELETLEQEIRAREYPDLALQSTKDAATVSVVGSGVAREPRLLSAVEETLANAGIVPFLLWNSPLSITCLVPRESCRRAVGVLHERFFPDGISKRD
ncbi:MAG: aspartate kinase [Chitinivibrionia bacterium]|nr:aspartate kinase [Chitinivibrionia bacterium]